jgi:hypothetical protein
MKSPARLGFLIAACLLGSPGLRADAGPSRLIPSVALKDGRTLHNVKVMSSEDDSIVVHADEGLMKIMKSLLPPGFAAGAQDKAAEVAPGSDLVMQAFNPNQAPAQEPGAKPAPKVTPVPKVPAAPKASDVNPVFKGCTIVSFQMKTFQNVQGCAEIVIRNDSDANVVLFPRDIICVTAKGVKRGGRIFVTDGFPPQIKRRELVVAQGQIDDIVTFTDDALDIAAVHWAK